MSRRDAEFDLDPDVADLEARIVELELRFMEQAAVVDALDSVVRDQDGRLDSLELRLHVLQRRLEAAEGSDDDG